MTSASDDRKARPSPEAEGVESAEVPTKRGGRRVLVVDDAEDTRELFALALHEAGFDVATAADGSEAVASALIAMPGVIVMDLAMPVMDGCQATRHIRAADPTRGAYIIALTAFDGPEWAARARASGCDEVLRKPCTCALLITCIEAAISRR